MFDISTQLFAIEELVSSCDYARHTLECSIHSNRYNTVLIQLECVLIVVGIIFLERRYNISPATTATMCDISCGCHIVYLSY